MTSSMKKTALSLFCVASLMSAIPATYAADGMTSSAPKPAFLVVDMNAVLAGSIEAQALTLKFQGAVEGDNGSLNSIATDMQGALAKAQDLQKEYANATAQADKDKIKSQFDSVASLYQTKQQEATNMKNTDEQQLSLQRQTYLQAVVLKIRSAAADIAKKRGVGAVTTTDIALYYDPSWDISKDIITLLNSEPPSPAPEVPSVAPAAAPAKTTGASK
jgi:Skp family chaperone for outer membrane proteins